MSERIWLVLALLAGASFAIQVSLPMDLSERPETTFETAPRGHAGLFELLGEFQATRGRWTSGVSMPPSDQTIWWIAPEGVCEPRNTPDVLEAPFRYTALPWIESGGTAVVWLSHPPPAGAEPEPIELPPAGDVLEVSHRPAADRMGDGVSDAAREDRERSTREDEAPAEAPTEDEDPDSVREQWRSGIGETRRALREGEPARCPAIAGHALPRRRWAGLVGGELPIDAEHAAIALGVGRWTPSREDFDHAAVRALPGPTLAFFESEPAALAGWQPLWVEADDFTAFALERPIGTGRLVVVADARVLTNARLAKLDSAPFVFDWVGAYGTPWIDEHSHGVVPEAGAFRYLASSPARAACLGLLGLGLLLVWRGHAWPTRRVSELDPEAPTLSAFVDSVARLYAETGDHQQVFERYRAVCLDRIRRALGLGPGTPAETVLAMLAARADAWSALRDTGLRDLMTRDVRIEDAAALERAAARLDALVDEVRRERRDGVERRAERSAGT